MQTRSFIWQDERLTLSSGLVARREGWLAGLEDGWGEHVVPLFFDEWVRTNRHSKVRNGIKMAKRYTQLACSERFES